MALGTVRHFPCEEQHFSDPWEPQPHLPRVYSTCEVMFSQSLRVFGVFSPPLSTVSTQLCSYENIAGPELGIYEQWKRACDQHCTGWWFPERD